MLTIKYFCRNQIIFIQLNIDFWTFYCTAYVECWQKKKIIGRENIIHDVDTVRLTWWHTTYTNSHSKRQSHMHSQSCCFGCVALVYIANMYLLLFWVLYIASPFVFFLFWLDGSVEIWLNHAEWMQQQRSRYSYTVHTLHQWLLAHHTCVSF